MKKIVSILGAVAVLASSAFALDISAMIQLDGDIAAFGKDTTKLFMLKEWDPQGTSDYHYKFDVSGDKAGATVFNYAGGDNNIEADTENVHEWNLWFKPVDMLKVTVGDIYHGSAQPHFGWWAKVIDHADYGYQADLSPIDGLNLTFGIGSAYTGLWESAAHGTYWFDKNGTGLRKLGEFWAGGSYNVDGVGAFGLSIDRGAKVNPHGFAQTQAWGATPLALDFYYSNQPWGQTGWFADAALVWKEKSPYGSTEDDFDIELDRLTSQLYFELHSDAFALYLIDVLEYNFDENAGDDGKTKAFKDGFELKAQYAIDAYTPYIQIDGYNVMDSKLGVKLAVGFSVGSCSFDVGPNFAINWADSDNTTFDVTVPIQFTLNF